MNWQERAEKAEAELARMAQQEPVAWMRPDDEGYDSHFRDHSTDPRTAATATGMAQR